jgi:hypothetical protein
MTLPSKWKKAIPAFLTSASWLVIGLQFVFETTWGVVPNILAIVSMGVGVFLGITWTPPDPPAV